MATPAVFPSLTRNASMDSSQTSEDDTIRDQSESGYVATRPRFTRARRTFKANWRYLTLEDVRALEHFRDSIVKRGALPFYFPSIVKNGSFEIPATTPGTEELADGWQARSDVPSGAVTLGSQAFDGNVAVQLASTAGQVVGGAGIANALIGGVQFVAPPVASPGDTLGFGFWYNVLATSQTLYFEILVTLICDSGIIAAVAAVGVAPGSGWRQAFGTVVVPMPPGNPIVKAVQVAVSSRISGFSTKPTLDAGEVIVLLDAVGVAVTATAQRQALMVGSTAITRQVRFTKLPEFADLGIIGGVKRYGTTFEVTEL